jgi:hypothetical protein
MTASTSTSTTTAPARLSRSIDYRCATSEYVPEASITAYTV